MFNHKVLLEQYNQLQNKVIEIGRYHLPDTYYMDTFEIDDEFVGVYYKKFKSDDCVYITFNWEDLIKPIQNLQSKFKKS
jgi:hypothetical protein